jgi:hypothetical protein
VVTAVPVARKGCGSGAFEVDAGEVVESEDDGGFECLGGEFFSKAHQCRTDGMPAEFLDDFGNFRVETPWTYISARESMRALSLRMPFSRALG